MATQQMDRTAPPNRGGVERYLREMIESHQDDPDYRVEFACYFHSRPDTIDLIEVSPNVLDPGDEEFYSICLAAPPTFSDVRHLRITLITPSEFDRARRKPDSPGGQMLDRLRRGQDFHVLAGDRSRYAQELRRAAI